MSQFDPRGGVSIFQINLKLKKVSNIRYLLYHALGHLDTSVPLEASIYTETCVDHGSLHQFIMIHQFIHYIITTSSTSTILYGSIHVDASVHLIALVFGAMGAILNDLDRNSAARMVSSVCNQTPGRDISLTPDTTSPDI